MRERERHNDERPEAPAATGPDGDGLDAMSETAARMLAAGDAAIDRALSQDSEAFLRATRQHGGE